MNMRSEIKLYYCKIPNFGDAINPILIERLTGRRCIYSSKYRAEMAGVGSILHKLTRKEKTFKLRNIFSRPTNVWTSGFIEPSRQKRILRKNVQFLALRGKESLRRVEDMLGRKLSIPLGDGGLLFNHILDRKPGKKYSVGLVPHGHDFADPSFRKLHENIKDSVVIDITAPPMYILETIAECEFIISSALHGLIAADSLGIPNIWFKCSDKLAGVEYKFKDYYSVFDIDDPAHLVPDTAERITIGQIPDLADAYPIKQDSVIEIQAGLLNALKEYVS